MESIPKENCQKVGYLQKPHGIKGEIVLQMEDDYTESFFENPTVFLEIDGLLVPFFISDEGVRSRSAEAILLQLDWVDNEEQARKLCGSSVYLLKEDILYDEEEVSIHHLVGFVLFDDKKGKIGPIEQVDDFAGNLILMVQYKGEEVLVPFNEDFLVRFDDAKKEIELQCPDGIFEV